MTVSATQRSPTPPATRSVSRFQIDPTLITLPDWAHPEVFYWYPTWTLIRDCIAGEARVKTAGTQYLPQMEGMDPPDYDAFVDRATFYNFTGRTVGALTGSIFRRMPVVEGLAARLEDRLATVAQDGNSLTTFASFAAEEIESMGRFGVLLDLPPYETTDPQPYLCGYAAEHILDWDEEKDPNTGRRRLVRVVLREAQEMRTDPAQARQVFAQYRELVLQGGVYRQYVYSAVDRDAQLNDGDRGPAITPLRRGAPLDYIPFRIFGPFLSTAACEKPPMEDIARLNISHYRSYAYLEHGRFFCGFPIFYAEDTGNEEEDIRVGSSEAIIVRQGGKPPGFSELNGQGLKFLVDALDQKESQAASLGGRMMGIRSNAVSESNNQLKLAERNEQSILLKTARSLDEGFTQVMRWWAWWSGMAPDEVAAVEVTFNKDFLFDGAGAREFRAIHALYKDGFLPVEVFYEYFKKFNVIPDWMRLQEFKGLVDKLTSFPGGAQPDAEARSEGFPDKATQLLYQDHTAQRTHETDLQDSQLAADKAAATAAAKAAAAARPAAPPNSARGAFGGQGAG